MKAHVRQSGNSSLLLSSTPGDGGESGLNGRILVFSDHRRKNDLRGLVDGEVSPATATSGARMADGALCVWNSEETFTLAPKK